MAVQDFIIAIVFILSLVYLSRKVYAILKSKSGCNSCAGACSTINFEEIALKIKSKQ
jgi:hypothetical protein